MTKFTYVNLFSLSTSVGSGKTRAAIRYMAGGDSSQNFQNFIYVAPTLKLVDQTAQDLKAACKNERNIHLIHSENSSNVQELILDTLNNYDRFAEIGHVVICTTTTFLKILQLIQGKGGWKVILDEAFSVLEFETWALGRGEHTEKNRARFDDLFDIDPGDKHRISAKAGKKKYVQALAAKNWDDVGEGDASLSGFAAHSINPAVRLEFIGEQSGSLVAAVWMLPELFDKFKKVIILSAIFEYSLLYYLWTSLGVTFSEHPQFTSSSVDNIHQIQGEFISIGHILHKDDKATRHNLMRNHETGEGFVKGTAVAELKDTQVIDKVADLAAALFPKDRCLVVFNEWSKTQFNKLKPMGNFELIPLVCHGLNKWLDVHNIVYLATTNPEPFKVKWLLERFQGLESVDVIEADIYRCFRIHNLYQAVGRTSIRNKYDHSPKTVITLGIQDARFLHDLFEGSNWLGQVGNLESYEAKAERFKRAKAAERSKSNAANDPEYQAKRKEYMRLKERVKRGVITASESTRLEAVDQWFKARKKAV